SRPSVTLGITKPPEEFPNNTTGPLVRCARNDAIYGASIETPRNRLVGARTVKSSLWRGDVTAFQLEASAHAPWTRTIVGLGMFLPYRVVRSRRPRSAEPRPDTCAASHELLRAVRTGESGTLVLRGEARIDKSALLDYAAAHAEGCEVVRATGVESEMELPFATLHHPCLPLLERVDRLPAPQAAALRTAFGLSSGVGV